MVGKKRCALHGGKATGPPKGSKNAQKHGIYSKGLTEDEKAIYDDVPLGVVDDEIKVARLMLARAMKAQKEALEAPSETAGLEVDSIEQSAFKNENGTSTARKITRKRKDFQSAIDRLLGRIGKLELIRDTIGGDGDGSGNIADMFKAIEESEDDLGEVREEIAQVPENAD